MSSLMDMDAEFFATRKATFLEFWWSRVYANQVAQIEEYLPEYPEKTKVHQAPIPFVTPCALWMVNEDTSVNANVLCCVSQFLEHAIDSDEIKVTLGQTGSGGKLQVLQQRAVCLCCFEFCYLGETIGI